MSKGRIIVIEGACDGIGKTTQYELLKEKLEKEGKVYTHHFPSYNSDQGKLVEKYLSGELGDKKELSNYLIHDLYAIDRAVTWLTELKQKYDEGYTILLDRYTTSSEFYQSVFIDSENGKKEFVNFVEDYEYNKLGIGKPDLVIFLTAPYDVVTKFRNERKENEGISNDIHERDAEFMRKVYDNGMFISNYLGWSIVDCSYKNSFKNKEEISNYIYNLVKNL